MISEQRLHFLTSLFHQVQKQTWHFTSFRISDTSSADTSELWAWRPRNQLTHSAAGQADPISIGIDIESPRGLSCRRQSRRAPRRLCCRGARQGSGGKTTSALHLAISEPRETLPDRQPSEHSLIYTKCIRLNSYIHAYIWTWSSEVHICSGAALMQIGQSFSQDPHVRYSMSRSCVPATGRLLWPRYTGYSPC